MSRREQVQKAISMQNPDHVPILYFNGDKSEADAIFIDVIRHFTGDNGDLSEWGFTWERFDETMGHPTEPLLKSWDDLDKIQIPDAFDMTRYNEIERVREQYGEDRYYIASLVLTGFTIMTFLRGFENVLLGLYEEEESTQKLADAVFGFEENIIRNLAGKNVDAVAFFDDWGTQTNLIVSPDMWRAVFKPMYKRQFQLVHDLGLKVFFHCCGYIYDIIPDLIEIGVDVLNLSQPNLFDISKLGNDFGGKVCFMCPVSYQTTSLSGTKDEIYKDVKLLMDNLGCYNGGLIGYVEEYRSIGLSDENFNYCVRAFRELGRYNLEDINNQNLSRRRELA